MPVHGQGTGSVQGTVTFAEGGAAVHGAVVLVVGPGLVALTAENGVFEIENVLPGTYEILAQREHLTARRQTVTIQSEQTSVVDFALELSPVQRRGDGHRHAGRRNDDLRGVQRDHDARLI